MATLQKYRDVLTIVQDALKQMSQPAPVSVYTSQDENAVLMGSVINLAGQLINSAYAWQQRRGTLTCTGDGTTTDFPLPEDFDRLTDNTGWSSAIRRPVTVLNDQQWAAIASWLSQSFYVNPACMIENDNVRFMSAPASGDEVTFFYQKATWVIDADTPATIKIAANKNGDIPMFDYMLMILAVKLKWREAKGFDTLAVQQDLNDRISQLTSGNQMAPILPLSGPNIGNFRYLDGYYNSPDTNYGV